MSAWENIAFPLKAQNVERHEVDKRVADVAELLQIGHLLKQRPGSLSGGDQQRVALARALVRRPAAFLMDEPLGALDADFREQMRAEIKRLHISQQATSVYVTHDQVEAMAMADRIVVMSRAAVQQIGTPAEVYFDPANLFVANFIGSPGMNLVTGQFAEGIVHLPGGQQYRVPEEWKDAITQQLGRQGGDTEHRQVVVGFRPEAGQLAPDGELGDTIGDTVAVEVYAVDMNGSDVLLYLTLDEHTLIRIRVDRSVRAPLGTKINMRIDPNYVRFFDAKTEAALKLRI
jgi:multiple sugar transport system ATP-binding protein